ncbi:MAG: hypothetical protein AB7F28_03035 [Candidatus Margulisiibacteriota bacterium]
MNTFPTLNFLLKHQSPTAVLFDAVGTLYNEYGPIPGIGRCLTGLQQTTPIWVVTNNSTDPQSLMVKRLATMGIIITEDQVLSSGLALGHDPVCRNLIQNKRVFVLGPERSYGYVQMANPAEIVSQIEASEVLVMTSTLDTWEAHDPLFEKIETFIKTNIGFPIICCNPDRFVMGQRGIKIPVVGYFAEILEKCTPVVWAGKPHAAFLGLVQETLSKSGITTDSNVFMIDDLIENLLAFQTHLGVSGVWVKDTGLGAELAVNETRPPFNQLTAILNAVSAKEEI